jgi:hypothetical protein
VLHLLKEVSDGSIALHSKNEISSREIRTSKSDALAKRVRSPSSTLSTEKINPMLRGKKAIIIAARDLSRGLWTMENLIKIS